MLALPNASFRLLVVPVLALFGAACMADPDTSPLPVENSMYRVGKVTQLEKNDIKTQIFRSRAECRGAMESAEADDCVPSIDRATGQVKVAFRFTDKTTGDPIRLPLEQDQVQVSHMGAPQANYQLIQHRPVRVPQLFILLLDGSGSMHNADGGGETAIQKLYGALMNPKVVEAFFPDEIKTGVTLLKFTDQVHSFDGGGFSVIESRKLYKQTVQTYIMGGPRGWTYLYASVRYVVGDFLKEPAIENWLALNAAEPTVVALTDGFNNEQGSDTCATNAPRLEETLQAISGSRNGPIGQRPTLYTVGLGRKIMRDFEVPQGRLSVTPRELCKNRGHQVINGDLERIGIDNASLEWMAAVGGGASFTRNEARGLAQTFQAAAATRFEWYELIYQVDPFFHRTSFKTRVRLMAYAYSQAEVEIFPSGWMDAPTGQRTEGERWSRPTPFRHTLTLLMPLLSALVLIAFWAPASFNARRAAFRRAVASKGPTPPKA